MVVIASDTVLDGLLEVGDVTMIPGLGRSVKNQFIRAVSKTFI
jgi:hypothetical protein